MLDQRSKRLAVTSLRRTAGALLLLQGGLLLVDAAPAGALTLTPNTEDGVLDGTCDAHCSLADAVAVANATPGADTIVLNDIDPDPDVSWGNSDPLPTITAPLTITGAPGRYIAPELVVGGVSVNLSIDGSAEVVTLQAGAALSATWPTQVIYLDVQTGASATVDRARVRTLNSTGHTEATNSWVRNINALSGSDTDLQFSAVQDFVRVEAGASISSTASILHACYQRTWPSGTYASGGYNVIEIFEQRCTFPTASTDVVVPDAGFRELAFAGGTPTYDLLESSAAIDLVPTGTGLCPADDFSGLARPVGAACDAGPTEENAPIEALIVDVTVNSLFSSGSRTAYPALGPDPLEITEDGLGIASIQGGIQRWGSMTRFESPLGANRLFGPIAVGGISAEINIDNLEVDCSTFIGVWSGSALDLTYTGIGVCVARNNDPFGGLPLPSLGVVTARVRPYAG